MLLNHIFYLAKPLIPRATQLYLRRKLIQKKRQKYKDEWPVYPGSEKPPSEWKGWPDNKKFAFVLTHDVEKTGGFEKCVEIMQMEKELGFVSSFNFVPERYNVRESVRHEIEKNGFEVGVHGLNHDGKLYQSEAMFKNRAQKINAYIKEWNSAGFRSPAMHHNLNWIQHLDIIYDASTFDTDPFEPQSDGVNTIFPFIVKGSYKSYVELPYTLPQDFTLLVLMKNSIDIWKEKTAWIYRHNGMVLLNTHPDYMALNGERCRAEQFPVQYYYDFLAHIKEQYKNEFWNPLPKDLASFWLENYNKHFLEV